MGKHTTLYDLLGVGCSATESEITRAYRLLALKYHPDRNPDGVEMFKKVNDAYSILRDPARRGIYDTTGSTGTGDDGANAFEPMSEEDQARRFAELSTELDMFYETYMGSQEEIRDAINAYATTNGNFEKMILCYLIFNNANPAEVRRLRALLQQCIDAGTVNVTKKWTKTSTDATVAKLEKALEAERAAAEVEAQKKRRAGRSGTSGAAAAGSDSPQAGGSGVEATATAAKPQKKNNNSDRNLLQVMISSRQKQLQGWERFTDKLMAKYCPGDTKADDAPRRKKSRR